MLLHHQPEGFLPQHTHGLGPEYMRINISNLPLDFFKDYILNNLATNNGTIYV
jgi:hypothetical protein